MIQHIQFKCTLVKYDGVCVCVCVRYEYECVELYLEIHKTKH